MEQRTSVDISQINEMIERESVFIDALTNEMNKVIVGQKHMVNALLIGLLGKRAYPLGRGTWASKNAIHQHPC